jgi:uncharacterized membrane protein
MATEVEVYAVAGGVGSKFRTVYEENGKAVEGDAVESAGQVVAMVAVGVVDAGEPYAFAAHLEGEVLVHEDGKPHFTKGVHKGGDVVITQDGCAAVNGFHGVHEASHAFENVLVRSAECVPVVAGERAEVGVNGP